MLIPRRLGGSFGAADGVFRVLVCRAQKPGCCGATWTANDSHALARHWEQRKAHEALCAVGTFENIAP
jgi:hypothetical protein